jgi:hypothetical protein
MVQNELVRGVKLWVWLFFVFSDRFPSRFPPMVKFAAQSLPSRHIIEGSRRDGMPGDLRGLEGF